MAACKKYQPTACAVCGTMFQKRKKDHLCCSEKCQLKRRRQYEKEMNALYRSQKKDKAKKIEKTNHEKIADIAIAAREEGLSYGQYVAKYGANAGKEK